MRKSVPKTIAKKIMLNRFSEEIKISRSSYEKRNQFVLKLIEKAKINCGAKILDPTGYLCNERYCIGSLNKRPLYYDGDHLSEFGNQLLIPMFKNMLKASDKL